MPDPTLGEQVWSRLRPDDRMWLRGLAGLAVPGKVALVGGAVRDALLGQVPTDLDVVLEGADVEALARGTGQPYLFHPAFQNATLTFADGRSADLVRARRETYPVAGQNPVPERGTLRDDLRRRDFSLNALALLVPVGGAPELLDVVGGLGDLHARALRPLHPRSFHEDASRLIRAARLSARLGLRAHPELLAQVPDALALAPHTPRLWAELKLLLGEPRPGQAALRLREWGAGALLPGPALPDLDPLLALDRVQDGAEGVGEGVAPQTYAAALLAASADPVALAARLGLGERPAALLARAQSDTFYPEHTPEQQLRRVLRPDFSPPLTGKDVLALGIPPGPRVGEALAHLGELRRAGQLRTRDQEVAALHAWAAQSGAAPPR